MNKIKKILIALICILLFPGCISTPTLDARQKNKFELNGTRWVLYSMNGQELLEDTAITLKITEGEISGSSGCNFYGAKYTTQPTSEIEITELALTAMACYEPAGILEQEEEYINIIRKATNFSIKGENLFMMDEQGSALLQYRLLPKFEANPESLIGKTWQLSYADGMEEYELSAFTLWFDGSLLGGTTSCRDYEGTYQLVEDGIHVISLRMANDVECLQTDLHAEATFTTLLERTDQYNVSQNRLELNTVQNDRLIFESNSETISRNTAYPIDASAAQATQIYPEPLEVPTMTPLSDNDRAIYAFLAQYDWTINYQISTHSETLPETFLHEPGDFPYTIYWAYNNVFSKEIGLDIAPYLGQTVQASLFQLNEPLPEEFRPYTTARAVVLTLRGEIIGAWIDKDRSGFACSLNRKQFEDLVELEWDEWLVYAGVVNLSNELDNKLATMTPEEIIEIYYTALNEHDYRMFNAARSRRAITYDLYVNMSDDKALFNHQEDASITKWIDNIESAKLLNVTRLKGYHCLPVYAATVNFQFVDPKLPTIPEGTNVRFVVVNKEIEELGWRIEEINTAPGVSQRLCISK